jgi:tetratricopeptide (TPR) repeat protein
LQVALVNALMHTKGHAAAETKTSIDQARSLIARVEALGEPLEDPLLLFSILYGFFGTQFVAFNGDVVRELSVQFLTLAEKHGGAVPLMIGHRLVGTSLMCTGEIAEVRAHFDRAIALYNPTEHRPLATRFGQDLGVTFLLWRSFALWLLGYPDAALSESESALKQARETGHAATLMYALAVASLILISCRHHTAANTLASELVALADEKGAYWKATGTIHQACTLVSTGGASNAIQMALPAITAYRSTGSTLWTPMYFSYLAKGYVELDQFDKARRWIGDAVTAAETTKQRLWEAEIHRTAGEITLLSESDVPKAEVCFERALAITRRQGAKSLELRAAMSIARLWRDQGKRQQAHDLLAPVFGWFTEGFDTLDLKEAKELLEQLKA